MVWRGGLLFTVLLLVAGCDSQAPSGAAGRSATPAAGTASTPQENGGQSAGGPVVNNAGEAAVAEDLDPVHGVVTLDGQPLSGGELVFLKQSGDPLARPPSAITNAKGEFRLTWDGADAESGWVGKYKVIIRARQSGRPVIEKDTAGSRDLPRATSATEEQDKLPRAYADEQTTPFTVEIRPGANEFRIQLDSRFDGPGH
jgi:hypothetical protein